MSADSETGLQRLRAWEPIARRAPSPHNTQPWRLVYSADRVRLDYDAARHLTASDPSKRDLLLALGAFVECFLIASCEARIPVEFVPDVDFRQCRAGWFQPTPVLYETQFTSTDILSRRTSRLGFQPAAIDQGFDLALRRCLSPGERIAYLQGSEVRDLLAVADRHLLDTLPVAAELRHWSRLLPAEAAGSEDGMTPECLALSAAQARVLSFLLSDSFYPWFRFARLSAPLVALTSGLVANTTPLIALVAEAGGESATLKAGQSLMRLWLLLSKRGLHAQPLSQILDCAGTNFEASGRLGLAPGDEIMCLFRVGASAVPAASRRLGEVLPARPITPQPSLASGPGSSAVDAC